jgi:D-alanyl-lipoteichoic acid acyltransferase DltB (MBOAT superfamily)
VAGPIDRASHLLPHLKVWRAVCADDIRIGLERIISGLFMKLVIADRLAIFVDLVFANPGHYPAFTLWVAAICFTGQIYMDFAGYASIAIGTARLFGVRIVENFNYPMAARNSGDFWARWHITLTSWFRDYLFLPLGGFRRGGFRSAVNGGIVLVLCGFWHGAQWHFVAWGAFHAILMILYFSIRTLRRRLRPAGARRKPATGIRVLPWALFTLGLNAVGVVFFRAANLDVAWDFLGAMFLGAADPGATVEGYVWVFLGLAGALFLYDFGHAHLGWGTRWRNLPWHVRAFGYAALAGCTVWGAVNFEAPYIYFQF